MTIIAGVVEKAGRMNQGQLHGDDIVSFWMRLTSLRILLEESIEILNSEAGIAKALATTRTYGFSLVEGVRIIDDMRHGMEQQLKNSHDNHHRFSMAFTTRLKGSEKPVVLHRYDGTDEAKKGRVYVRGEILEQEVIIPAAFPKLSHESKNKAQDVIRETLPVARFGQFMFPNIQALGMVRVVEE